jgi:hypothetical protein
VNITLQLADTDVTAQLRVVSDKAAEADLPCPSCAQDPLPVYGRARRIVDENSHEADGHCFACHAHVGLIRAEYRTIFGATEDAAVRAEIEERGGRVYGD